MTVPVWLLDIDGVINALGGSDTYRMQWPNAVWRETRLSASGDGAGFRITVAQPVIDFIIATHEDELAEIRWHTTWQADAQRLADWAGLPTFPVHDAPEFNSKLHWKRWWKLPAAHRVVNDEGRKLLWTDDDIRYELRRDNTLRTARDCKIIAPNDMFGLSPDNLEEITIYLHKMKEAGD